MSMKLLLRLGGILGPSETVLEADSSGEVGWSNFYGHAF